MTISKINTIFKTKPQRIFCSFRNRRYQHFKCAALDESFHIPHHSKCIIRPRSLFDVTVCFALKKDCSLALSLMEFITKTTH